MTGEGIPISTSLLANGLSLVHWGDACPIHPAWNDAVIKAETSKQFFPWVGIMCPHTLHVPGNGGDFPMSANYTDPVKKGSLSRESALLGVTSARKTPCVPGCPLYAKSCWWAVRPCLDHLEAWSGPEICRRVKRTPVPRNTGSLLPSHYTATFDGKKKKNH